MATPTMKFNIATENVLKNAKFKRGFSNEELSAFEPYFGKAEILIHPFRASIEKIAADKTLSHTGKSMKLEAVKAETIGRLNGIVAADFDKSVMIGNLQQLQAQKVANARQMNRPENEVLAYLQQQELRHHLQARHEKHFDNAQRVGATNDEKADVDGPMVKALVDAAVQYVGSPKTPADVQQNRRSELVLSAVLDGPYELVPAEMRQRIEQHLTASLAMDETERLHTVQIIHDGLQAFSQDLKAIILEA